jgi:hypothetical protein
LVYVSKEDEKVKGVTDLTYTTQEQFEAVDTQYNVNGRDNKGKFTKKASVNHG